MTFGELRSIISYGQLIEFYDQRSNTIMSQTICKDINENWNKFKVTCIFTRGSSMIIRLFV